MEEWVEGITYRMAYGLAARLADARDFSLAYGRVQSAPAAGGDVARLAAEVLRPMALEGPCPAAVRAGIAGGRQDPLAGRPPRGRARGIADALAGRRPRW